MAVITQEYFEACAEMSMTLGICFCMCGCQNDGVLPASLLGMPVPGLCDPCKRAKKGHARIATAGMYDAMRNPVVDEPVVPVRTRRERHTTTEQRDAALAYIERTTPMTQTVAELAEKVGRGGDLTDRQVELALAAEAAEKRDYERAQKRLVKDHARKGKATDLTRIRIPETVQDGPYAVEADTGDMVLVKVERPTEGLLRKSVVVTFVLGDKVRYGVQRLAYPGFLGRLFPTYYKGWFPQVIADLVAEPEFASEMYKEMTGG